MPMTFLLLSGALAAAKPGPADLIAQASGAALQANARDAVRILEPLRVDQLPPDDRNFVVCMRERFGGAPPQGPVDSSLAGRSLALYMRYWRSALLHPDPQSRQRGQQELESELRTLLNAPQSADMGALENELQRRLQAEGWHSLEGQTGLLRELMMWKDQEEKTVTVALPDGAYPVRVVLLDGFRSFGWSHYATCGRRSTGGWATEDALFAVVPRYHGLDSEEFRVTFLGHETQHFADKARFPGLLPWELEYRAKLVELGMADETRRKVLGKFIEDQGDDPGSPHSYANKKVLAALLSRLQLHQADELMSVDLSALQSAARTLLLEDSKARLAAGGGQAASNPPR